MKRVMVRLGLILAILAGLVVISIPLLKQLVKRRIVAELRQFIREGSLSVEDISVSPKRRQARLFGLTVKDRNGIRVLYIPKIDLDVRRIHHGHMDASARVFEPAIDLDAGRIDRLSRLFRMEAFLKKGRVEIDRLDAQGGRLTLSAPGILASSETMSLEIRAQLEGGPNQTVEFRAANSRTSLNLILNLDAKQDETRFLDGTSLNFSSTHLALSPASLSSTESGAFHVQIVPADTMPAALADIPWNVAFTWGPLQGQLRRLRPSADSPGLFTVDETRLTLGGEELACYQNRVEPREGIRWESARWVRTKTGLALENVNLTASRKMSNLHAEFAGRPVDIQAEWGNPPHLYLTAETIPIPLLLQEIGESLPVSGSMSVRLEASPSDSLANQISWKANIYSTDLLAGPSFGKISLRADLELAGMDSSVDKLSGTVEPAPGVLIQVTGKGGRRGFSGHASLKDRPLKDIRLLGETFGKEIPLVGESGRAGLDVDFTVKPNLEFNVRGRVRIKDATALSKGFPFRVEGLDVDIPFELSPDTGKLVVADAANGRADARLLVIGPYRFDNFSMKTSSKGDKIFTDINKK